jgi:hypothetical protein
MPRITDPAGPDRRARLVRAVGLQLVLLVVTLAAVELILRLADLRELRNDYVEGAGIMFRHDPELGWFPIANMVTEFSGTRPTTIRTNSLGLRDPEHDRTAKPTIMFLGDSMVWGYDAEAHERFTDILRADFPNLRIVNAGVSGYGTDQQYLLLERFWDLFRPSVVVLIFNGSNDYKDNATNMITEGYYKPHLIRSSDGEWKFVGQPVPKSRHYYFRNNALVRNLWLARVVMTGYVYVRHPAILAPDPTDQLIAMMYNYVTSRGARFAVGLRDQRAPLLQDRNAATVSLDDAEVYPDYGSHWTPAGHRLVADRLRGLLQASGIPDGSPNPAAAASKP